MNERIQELATEVGISAEYLTNTKQWTLIEALAELIVRQCGYYADIFEAVGCPDDMDPTETKPSDYIKRHFGVEE